MRQIKFRIFFDNEMLPWNGHVKGNPFYLAPTAGAPCIVFYHDKTYEPHFIGEGRLTAVMQFTGFKDKNAKEIYDGDILRYWDGTDKAHYKIYWDESQSRFFDTRLEDGDSQTNYDGFEFVKDCEVIGNIHENPELL